MTTQNRQKSNAKKKEWDVYFKPIYIKREQKLYIYIWLLHKSKTFLRPIYNPSLHA